MFHLRLCKGLSYLGIVRATKAEPDVYVPEEEKAKALVASGYFEMVTSEAEKIQPLTGDTEKAESVTDMFEEETEDETQGDPELLELQKKKILIKNLKSITVKKKLKLHGRKMKSIGMEQQIR